MITRALLLQVIIVGMLLKRMKLLSYFTVVSGTVFVLLWCSLFVFRFLNIPLKSIGVNWKNVDLRSMPIPEEARNKAKGVEIEIATVEVENIIVSFRRAKPTNQLLLSGRSILFLHGKSFNSKTWKDLGTLQLMAALDHMVVAVDLPEKPALGANHSRASYQLTAGVAPYGHHVSLWWQLDKLFHLRCYQGGLQNGIFGYGNTREKYNGDRADFLLSFMKKASLSWTKPVLISPSMSGEYAVPFVEKYSHRLSGYIPIAPVATGTAAQDKLKRISLPTLILYGENDYTKLAQQSLNNLKIMPNSRSFCLQNARHAAYMDQTEAFHQILYNFLELLKNT